MERFKQLMLEWVLVSLLILIYFIFKPPRQKFRHIRQSYNINRLCPSNTVSPNFQDDNYSVQYSPYGIFRRYFLFIYLFSRWLRPKMLEFFMKLFDAREEKMSWPKSVENI